MKLGFTDAGFALFHSDLLDDDDNEPTRPGIASSPFDGLVNYASEVRIRAAVRAEIVTRRRRAS